MRRTVLVTGGAGYIGSHACKALALAGYVPITYDNLSRGHRNAVRWGPFVEGDLLDRERLFMAMRTHAPIAVIHFAALAYVGESVGNPGLYYRNNVGGTLTLLEAMLEAGLDKIVFSSTCATYGIPDRVPIDEGFAQAPVNPYGETKLAIERALYWHDRGCGLRSVSLRYFNAAGADPDVETGEAHDPETHLIPLVIDAALGKGPPVQIFGTDYATSDGTAIRDYIHVQDLANAHVQALVHLVEGGATTAVNLGTGQGYSVREIIAAAEAVIGAAVPRQEGPRRAGDPPALVANPSRAATLLGWRAEMSDLPAIIGTALAWHQRGKERK